MIVSAAKSNVVDSDSIDVFLQSLDVPLGHLELPFQAQFAVFLYRRLLSAIVDKPNGDDDDDDDLDGNASSRAFDDWSTVLERIAQFKTANNVSDAVHAALLLEVIHTEILLDIQNEMYPEEYPKVDLMSKVNDCTAAAIDHAVDCITASFDAAVPLAAAIKQQFRDWLCVLLDSNVLVDVRSYRRVATLLARLDGGTETLRQCVARSARRAYADIRDRVASRTNAILDWNEFAPSLASEVTMLSTTQDPGIDTIRGIYRDVFRQALARDALWSAQASPSDWMEILSSMTVVDLDVKDVVESIGAVRLAGWVQQQREQVAGLVERMLLADRWTVADEKSGTSSSVVDVFSAMYGAMEALMATARKVGLDMPGRGGGSGSPAASEIVDLMNDYVDVYASSVVEAARPSPTALASKTGVVGRQTNSAHLIQVADHDHNKVRTRFGNMTKSLKSKLHAHTHSIDMSSSSSSPTSATSPPCETVAMPVAASSKSVDELAVRLCNCREALLRLTSLEYDLSERFSVDGSSMQRGREALGRQIAALQALIGERIVYHDLQATFDRLYNPAVSSATGFAAVMANQLDAIMSAAYAAVRDQHFPGEPSFPAIVHKVFAALMEALTWVTGHGAGGRCFADTDFMTFTEDIAAIQAMFGSELSEATAGALAKPFEERVQDLAQSSNEIAQRYSAGTCSKDDATIVLHRRTDPIAVAWVHAENKSR
ncbi:Major facilitator superfamily (MFS) profile domain-containing protein [Plasmodiophora brassicae]